MAIHLSDKKCVACEGGTPPFTKEQIAQYLPQVNDWELVDDKKIAKNYKFKDFEEAMAFVNKVAEIAESEGHHPDISISWNKVKLELTTHAIGGLSENDFILAAKVDKVPT